MHLMIVNNATYDIKQPLLNPEFQIHELHADAVKIH